MNFTDFIEVQLRALQKFTKLPSLVAKSRVMLVKLATIREDNQSFRACIQEGSSSLMRELFEVATAVFESKNEKVIMHGLVILQKLMNIRQLSMEQYDEIISHISCLKQIQDKELQMRTIQICLNLITPQLALVQNFDFIRKLYQICFHVAFSKELMTRKIAISAIIQLTQLIYEPQKYSHYTQEDIKRCGKLFNDFLSYLIDQKSQWIPKGLNVIVWDLIIKIIQIQGLNMIWQESNNLQKIQKLYDICLKKSFGNEGKNMQNKFDFIRYFRAWCFISVNLKMGVKQLERLKIISDLTAGFQQALFLEGALYILNSELMLTRSHAYPQLIILVDTLAQLAQQLCMNNSEFDIINIKPKQYCQSPTVLLQIDTSEIIDDKVIYRMLMNGVIDLRSKFQNYAIKSKTKSQNQSQIQTEAELQSSEPNQQVKRSFEYMSTSIIKLLKYLIMIDIGQKMTRIFIKQYQKWLLLTHQCKLPKVRNKFLEELFLLTRKLQKKIQVVKCIEATQIMFNLVYGYDKLLDSSSLVIILFSFQQLEEKIYKMKKSKEWIAEMSQFQIQNTLTMIQHLYAKDSITFTEQSLKYTLESLNQITLKVMEELSENLSSDRLRLQYKTFGIRKMKEIIELNATKIISIWNLFIAQFICLSNIKSQEIRRYSIEILTQTISKVLIMNVVSEDQILSIYFQLIKTKYVDVKISIVQKLKELVEKHGYKMQENSLVLIFKILKLVQEPEEKKQKDQVEKLMSAENALNQFLMKECLVYITSISSIKELILNFRIIQCSKSHEYSGVGLLWLIPDHIKRLWTTNNPDALYNEEYLELFSMLFDKLQSIIRQSSYPAMKNSAIHVMTQIVGENISLFSEEYLKFFIQKIFFKSFTTLMDKYTQITISIKDPENPIDKDACQTCREMFSNLIKLLKIYQSKGLLNQSHFQFIDSQIQRMLKIQRSVFLFNLLFFLRKYQEDLVINKNNQKTNDQSDNKLQELLRKKQETLDPKDRYIKAKVLGILKQAIQFYNPKQVQIEKEKQGQK